MNDTDDKTQPSLPAPEPCAEAEPPPATDPGGHEAPIEKTDGARERTVAETLADELVRAVTAAVDSRLAAFGKQLATASGKLSEFGRRLEQHQLGEEEHQKKARATYERLVQQIDTWLAGSQKQGLEIATLQRGHADHETRIQNLERSLLKTPPTEPAPAPAVDVAEPGGEG